jgi:hypothetical protein
VAQKVKVQAQGDGGRIRRSFGLGDEAQDVLARDGAIAAAVRAAPAIVAEDVIVIAAEADGLDRHGAGVKGGEGREVGFGQFGVVHENSVVTNFNEIIGKGDDAFDGEAVVLGILDDDDFSLPRCAPKIRAAEENVAIAVEKGGTHAGARDFNGHENIAAEKEIAGKGEQHHKNEEPELAVLGRTRLPELQRHHRGRRGGI